MSPIHEKYEILKQKIRINLPFIIVASLIFLFLIFYLYNNIVYTVHSGEGGVLYRRFFGGTVVDKVYAEGIHFIFPWDKMYIYNVRIQQVPHEFDVLTREGLKVHLRISIRYVPEYPLLGVLHKVVGPDYVNTVVIPEIEMVLRVLVGKMNAEELYTTERAIIEKSINEAVEQVHQRFIVVDDVIIKEITLPTNVENAIQAKITQKHLADAHVFLVQREKLEKQRKIIEGQGMQEYNTIVNSSLTDNILQWMAIQATLKLATSENAKVVVVGSGERGLPVFGNLVLDAPGGVTFDLPADHQVPRAMPSSIAADTGENQPLPSITLKNEPESAASSKLPAESPLPEAPAPALTSAIPDARVIAPGGAAR